MIQSKNKTFIISEVGPNHNGSIGLAKEYITKLCLIGIDAIKFQLANPDDVYSKDAFKAEYQKQNDDSNSPIEMSRRYQLSNNDHEILSNLCYERNIEYMCTGFDLESLKFLNEELNISRFKIPSGEIFTVDILDYIKKFDKPVILSTGMATLNAIKDVVGYLNSNKKKDITILHCISSYPAPIEYVNMNVLHTIKSNFGTKYGFSDHTIGNLSSIVAVSMGASVIEKHVTIDKNLPGPDHQASATIEEFSELVDEIRLVEKIKGSFEKDFSLHELDVHKAARKSIVSNVDLNPGDVITKNDLCFKRPGTGISPMNLNLVLGKKVRNRIGKDHVVHPKDLYEG